MEMNEFVAHFAEQFDETDEAVFTQELTFRELEEWSSLIGLAILNMIVKKYGVKVSPKEFKLCLTIKDVYNLVQSKL